MARRTNKVTAFQREEASATKLLVKMEATGLSAKKLLENGLTSKQQILALRRCESRFETTRRREAAEAEKKAKQEKAIAEMGAA